MQINAMISSVFPQIPKREYGGVLMWQDTYSDILTEARPRRFFSNLPFYRKRLDYFLILTILATSIFVLIIAVKFRIFQLWSDFLSSSRFLRISAYPLLISTIIIISGLIFRTILWFCYKPMTATGRENWPFVSVIMPALNEENSIIQSIDSIFRSDYPRGQIEVICIDDGSTDSTLFNMLKAKQEYKERLKVIHFTKNLGKRKALYAGLKKSKGEIIVTVDTDSQIDTSSLKNLVIPLIKDKSTGAVAGRVEVLNEKENFLTRMLSLHYSISFNFGRAYQSVYGAVFCCPGALTAYRKNILWKFIDEWISQKFLNIQCTYGEDRALTNQILKLGYMTRFQSNAIVYTRAPSRLRQMIKMYLRWSRSYIRESILFAKFMFSNYRSKNRLLPIFDFFFINLIHPFHLFSFVLVCYSFLVHPFFILRHIALLVIASFLLSLYYLKVKRTLTFLYGIPYGLIAAFCLWWIVPYSALTMKNQSWMTR